MRTFLHAVMVAVLATLTSADVKVESHGVGLRDHSLDGKVSNQHLLFQADVSTKLACASACMKQDCCAAFSTSPKDPPSKKMTCRGHDSKSVTASSTIAAPGSKTYFMKTRPSASSWLDRPCSTDSDCPGDVDHVECFGSSNKCLCQPGYYYSHCRDGCVPDCAAEDLQMTFLVYPKRYLNGFNDLTIENCNSLEEVKHQCAESSDCRSMDTYDIFSECSLSKETALTQPSSFGINAPDSYYQRSCL